MITALSPFAVLVIDKPESLALFDRFKGEFAPGEWGNLVFSSTGTAIGEWYGYGMESYYAQYNGGRWRIVMNSSGFTGVSAAKDSSSAMTWLETVSNHRSELALIYANRFERATATDLEWSNQFGVASNKDLDVLLFSARFRGLPILSKRL
jgi:hypothetical protein